MGLDLVGRITHLMIYPVKSAAGIELTNAHLSESGLLYDGYRDHQYMIVRAKPNAEGVHEFITQRDKRDASDVRQGLSDIVHIKPRIIAGQLSLSWNYADPLPVTHNDTSIRRVRIWDEVCEATDHGAEVAHWLSDHLRLAVRLVSASGPFARHARQGYIPNANSIQFQDGYPIHWFPIESLNELNERARTKISWKSFRPQIVVEGMPAQSEHHIYSGTIANIPFVQPKPCDRCPITHVDQETSIVRTDGEPIRTLATYKRWKDKNNRGGVIFGENMLPQDTGEIKVGDTLNGLRARNPALVYGSKA